LQIQEGINMQKTFLTYLSVGILFFLISSAVIAEPDRENYILINDFEAETYGDWVVTGDAFGDGPAGGPLPREKKTSYVGKGLVSSKDKLVGTLTSPLFKIERKYINFLIGGGGFAGQTCMNLEVGGKVVRTAAGPNVSPGGSESLSPSGWDVEPFMGKMARLRIIDSLRGGWGHINVDHIFQSNELAEGAVLQLKREILIDAGYLQLPMMLREERGETFTIQKDGRILRFMDLKFPSQGVKPDFWYSYDVREFMGETVQFCFRSNDSNVLDKLKLSDEPIIDANAYKGVNRPRFHFSPRIGWMNDINGPYWLDGVYHMFFQHDPLSGGPPTRGFNKYWGHAVSSDLVHWQERPIALFPDETGNCYSGSALLLNETVRGINDKTDKRPFPVLFFTGTASNPRSQHIAMSYDDGKTWDRYSGNPVFKDLGSSTRDPKVFWHEPSKHYIMMLYSGETSHGPDGFYVLRSKNLIDWDIVSSIPGWYECPEFFQLKSPNTGEDVWVLYGCYRAVMPKINCAYQLGYFDGINFEPISDIRAAHQGPNFYGALTFVNDPKDRIVMMGWSRSNGESFEGELFNQCATVPLSLSLESIAGIDTLCMEPAEEVKSLRGNPILKEENFSAASANRKLEAVDSSIPLDIEASIRLQPGNSVGAVINDMLDFNFVPSTGWLTLNKSGKQEGSTRIHPDNTLNVRFLIDRGIVEAFWNNGQAAYAVSSLYNEKSRVLVFKGDVIIEELTVYPMSNIWD
jgi:fructan beta-fructosidase